MLANAPELSSSGFPLLLKLSGLVDRRWWFVLRMNQLPYLRACGAPQQHFDRRIIILDNLKKRLNPLGIRLGHRGERVERNQEFVGLCFVKVEH